MSRPRQDGDHYGEDLAYIHDAGFGFHANGIAPGLLEVLRENDIEDGTVVDLGCGSGIWARHLTDAGYDAVGVDQSPAMIRLARTRAPAARFHVASFVGFQLPRCRAITALGEVLCYQFDDANDRPALARLFRGAAAALNPGGLLIFDVAEVGLDKGRLPVGRAGDDWACVIRFEYDDARDQLIRHVTSFRRRGVLYRRTEETHRLQLFRAGDVAAMLRSVGFRVRQARCFGTYTLLPGRVAFIARKP